MRIPKVFGLLLVGGLILLTTVPVRAALMEQTFTLVPTDAGNPFGPVTGSVTFDPEDPSISSTGYSIFDLDDDGDYPEYALSVTVGGLSVTFDPADDMSYSNSGGYPDLVFYEGKLVAIDFAVDGSLLHPKIDVWLYAGDLNSPLNGGSGPPDFYFEISDADLTETYQFSYPNGTLPLNPVPIPPAAVLLASGLIAMLGFKRRVLGQDGKR